MILTTSSEWPTGEETFHSIPFVDLSILLPILGIVVVLITIFLLIKKYKKEN
jgi:hypothetical protein